MTGAPTEGLPGRHAKPPISPQFFSKAASKPQMTPHLTEQKTGDTYEFSDDELVVARLKWRKPGSPHPAGWWLEVPDQPDRLLFAAARAKDRDHARREGEAASRFFAKTIAEDRLSISGTPDQPSTTELAGQETKGQVPPSEWARLVYAEDWHYLAQSFSPDRLRDLQQILSMCSHTQRATVMKEIRAADAFGDRAVAVALARVACNAALAHEPYNSP
jgi:hypothetical protein